MSSMTELFQSSHSSGSNTAYLESLYEQYLADPNSVTAEWKSYFDALPGERDADNIAHSAVIQKFKNLPKNKANNQSIATS